MAIMDSTGALAQQYDYNAYGEVTVQGGGFPLSRILYAGYVYEADIEHYWMKFRVYDPESGRFLTSDPIGVWGDEGNWGNAYGYAGSNPTAMIDPFGLQYGAADMGLAAAQARQHVAHNGGSYSCVGKEKMCTSKLPKVQERPQGALRTFSSEGHAELVLVESRWTFIHRLQATLIES